MRVITSIRTACCLPLLAVLAVPAVAAQLDSGTGVQASREVATPPPTASSRSGAARPGSDANRGRMAQAARRPAPASSGSGKNTPP